MTSYVFTILEKKYHWDKVYQSLSEKYGSNFELVLAVKNSNPEKNEIMKFAKTFKRVSVLVVEDDKTENDMIAEAIKNVQGYEMVLCRDYFDYKTIFSDYMIEMSLEGAQVVAYKKNKKTSKLKNFFTKIYNKVIKKIFGFKLYEAEIGLIYFNNIALSVLKELPNSATFTKVNKWVGFEVSYIEIESELISQAKLDKSELKSVKIGLIACSALIALFFTGFVLLAVFNKLSFIVGLLFIFVLIITFFVLLYNILKFTFVNRYGNLKW